MKRIKTGVVGVGALGKHHLKWYSQLPESELIGFYDIDADKREKYSLEYNVTAFDTVEALAKEIEAASVVVPTSLHYEVGRVLMQNGVHCLVEKPVAATAKEAFALAALANERGIVASVGQIERFNPAVIALEGLKIRPSFIEAHRLAAFDPRGTDVAVVLDLMIHDIDLTLMLINSRVVDIHASAVAVISDKVDIANARLTFENGAVANLTASRISLNAMRKLRIFQQSGYFSLDLAKKQADLYRLAGPDTPSEGLRLPLGKSGKEISYVKKADNGEDMLAAELSAFLKAVAGKSAVAVTLGQGAEALRIALEIDRIGQESSQRMLEESPS